MSHTWIVVANSTRARIFAVEGPDDSFREVRDLVHPAARLHERELTSDLPGRSIDSAGQGGHVLAQKEQPKQHEAHVFAREVARVLETARTENQYTHLLLVAAPQFLGRLRDSLDVPTRSLVREEIAKNVVSLDARDIQARVAEQTL